MPLAFTELIMMNHGAVQEDVFSSITFYAQTAFGTKIK